VGAAAVETLDAARHASRISPIYDGSAASTTRRGQNALDFVDTNQNDSLLYLGKSVLQFYKLLTSSRTTKIICVE